VKETTAQDASGLTITASVDQRDGLFPRPVRPEAVDAAGPVDAQNAPTGPWKTADGFPQAPTAILVFVNRREERTRQRARPAHDNDRVPLRSPAVLSSLPLHRQK
jgi:hypothetical protein